MNQSEVISYIDTQIRAKTAPNTINPTIDASVLDAIVKMDLPQTDRTSAPIYGEMKQLAFYGKDIYFWDGTVWNYVATSGIKNYSFFIKTQPDGSLVHEDLVNRRLLKIEAFQVFYYENRDFTKNDDADRPTMAEGQSLLPEEDYLVLTAPL